MVVDKAWCRCGTEPGIRQNNGDLEKADERTTASKGAQLCSHPRRYIQSLVGFCHYTMSCQAVDFNTTKSSLSTQQYFMNYNVKSLPLGEQSLQAEAVARSAIITWWSRNTLAAAPSASAGGGCAAPMNGQCKLCTFLCDLEANPAGVSRSEHWAAGKWRGTMRFAETRSVAARDLEIARIGPGGTLYPRQRLQPLEEPATKPERVFSEPCTHGFYGETRIYSPSGSPGRYCNSPFSESARRCEKQITQLEYPTTFILYSREHFVLYVQVSLVECKLNIINHKSVNPPGDTRIALAGPSCQECKKKENSTAWLAGEKSC
ncbi:hypothetical protein CBL_12414 [Carabus blaptoides fortunei]